MGCQMKEIFPMACQEVGRGSQNFNLTFNLSLSLTLSLTLRLTLRLTTQPTSQAITSRRCAQFIRPHCTSRPTALSSLTFHSRVQVDPSRWSALTAGKH